MENKKEMATHLSWQKISLERNMKENYLKIVIHIDSQKMNNYSQTCDFWNSFNIVFTSAAIFVDELLVSFKDR